MLKPTRSKQCPSKSLNFGPSRQKCGLLGLKRNSERKALPKTTQNMTAWSVHLISTQQKFNPLLSIHQLRTKYNTLKKALIKTFGKSQAKKNAELLNLNGLGDKRPTALLRKTNALNGDPQTLKHALFLANLPSDVRSILAGRNFTDTDALAEATDRIWEARTSGVQQVFRAPTETHSANIKPPFEHNVVTPSLDETVSVINRGNRQITPQQRGTTSSSSVCFYHQRFGPDARRCLPGCKFASLLTKGDKQGTSSSGNAYVSRWTCQRLACLIQTRFRFMIDTLVSPSWSTLVLTYQFFQPLHRTAGPVHLPFHSLPQMELPSRPGAHATSL